MKLTRRLFTTLAASALAAGLALPATAADLAAIEKAGTIKIGMLVDFPPFGIQDASGNPDGYDADVAKALALGADAVAIGTAAANRATSAECGPLIGSRGTARSKKSAIAAKLRDTATQPNRPASPTRPTKEETSLSGLGGLAACDGASAVSMGVAPTPQGLTRA